MMNTTHSLVGELISADLDVHHQLPTITMVLRQRSNGYSGQRIIAMRSYPGTLAAARLARDHHAGLRCGALYRVAADAIGIGQDSVVFLLGVQDAQQVALEPLPYPVPDAPEPNSLAAEGACAGRAMGMPPHLPHQPHAGGSL